VLRLPFIRPSELFAYFEVEGTKFENGLFSLFDEDTLESVDLARDRFR